MKSDSRISELLVQTGAFIDLDQPVILTSGELGIYYINTEKLAQDGGAWKKFGDDSKAMVDHAIAMTEEHPTFGKVIDIIAEQVQGLLPEEGIYTAISGGQRRDWLFSGPVANKLGQGHISLYKDGKLEVLRHSDPGYGVNRRITDFSDTQVVHIVDLLTEGSSAYRTEDGEERGWVPMLRQRGAKVKDLAAVVTRLQGGEQMLAAQGVQVHPFVAIDEDFLRAHSTDPERAIAYAKDPQDWSEAYLRKHGALALVDTFDPDGGKVDRAAKFLTRYGGILSNAGKLEELNTEVRKRYGVRLK